MSNQVIVITNTSTASVRCEEQGNVLYIYVEDNSEWQLKDESPFKE